MNIYGFQLYKVQGVTNFSLHRDLLSVFLSILYLCIRRKLQSQFELVMARVLLLFFVSFWRIRDLVAVLTFLVVRECLIQCRILNDSPARLDFSGSSLQIFSNSETRLCPKKFRFFEFFQNHLVQRQLSLRLYFGIVRIVLLCNIMVQAILEDTLFMDHESWFMMDLPSYKNSFPKTIGRVLNQKWSFSRLNCSSIASQVDHSCDDDQCSASFYPESISICIISSYIIGWRYPICQGHLNKHPCHNENEMECRIAVCCLIQGNSQTQVKFSSHKCGRSLIRDNKHKLR